MTTNTRAKELPEIMQVYFMEVNRSEDVMTYAISAACGLYAGMYGFGNMYTHVAVRLGDSIYEVTLDKGLEKYEYTDAIFDVERMTLFYELDLRKISGDKVQALEFVLDSLLGTRLNYMHCLLYRLRSLLANFRYKQDTVGLAPGEVNIRKQKFHLPFTCCTPVNLALFYLLGFEPSFNNLVPMPVLVTIDTLSVDYGIGSIYIQE